MSDHGQSATLTTSPYPQPPVHGQPVPPSDTNTSGAAINGNHAPPAATVPPADQLFAWPADIQADPRFQGLKVPPAATAGRIATVRKNFAFAPLRPGQKPHQWWAELKHFLSERERQQQQQQQQQQPQVGSTSVAPQTESNPAITGPLVPVSSVAGTAGPPASSVPATSISAPLTSSSRSSPCTSDSEPPLSSLPPRQAPFAQLPASRPARPAPARQPRAGPSSRPAQPPKRRFRTAISEPTPFVEEKIVKLRSSEYDDILDPKVLGLSRKEALAMMERFPELLKDVKLPLMSAQSRTASDAQSAASVAEKVDVTPVLDLVTPAMLNNQLAVGDMMPVRRLLALITPAKTVRTQDDPSQETYAEPRIRLASRQWSSVVDSIIKSAPKRYLKMLGASDDFMKTVAFYFDRASGPFEKENVAINWLEAMIRTTELLLKDDVLSDPDLVKKYRLRHRMRSGMESTYKQVGRMEGKKKTAKEFRELTLAFTTKLQSVQESRAASSSSSNAPQASTLANGKTPASSVDASATKRRPADDDAQGAAAKKARTETAPLVRRVQAAPPKRADQSLFGAARADPLARFLGPAVASAASRPAPSANAAPMPAATSTTRPSSADSQTGATPPRQLDRSGKVKKTVRWRDANLVEIRAIEARDDMSNAPRHSGDFEREGEMLKHRLAEQTWYEPDALQLPYDDQIEADPYEAEAEIARRATVPAYDMDSEDGPYTPDESGCIIIQPEPGITQWFTPSAPAEFPHEFPDLVTPTASAAPTADLSALLAGLQNAGVLQNARPQEQPAMAPPSQDFSSVLASLSGLQQQPQPVPYYADSAGQSQAPAQTVYGQQNYYSPDTTPTNANFPSSTYNGRPNKDPRARFDNRKTKLCKFATNDARDVRCRELKGGGECSFVHPERGELLQVPAHERRW